MVENLNIENLVYVIECNSSNGCTVGGIVGSLEEHSVIRNCTVDENSMISVINNSSTDSHICVGGICGTVNYSLALIEGCENRASTSVSSPMNTSAGQVKIGGIAGNCPKIVNCINYGTISYTGIGHAGGIAGTSENIVSCSNYGDITLYCDERDGVRLTGGIVADCTTVINCINCGDIRINNSKQHDNYVGGICGTASDIIRCVNYGNIFQEDGSLARTAGIVGRGRGGTVDSCINHGNIDGCGIVGSRGYGGNLIKIKDCINIGCVSGESASGIIYFGGSTNLNILAINCINIGTVSDTSWRGGASIILGEPSSESIVAENCYTNHLYIHDYQHSGVEQCTIEQLSTKEFYTDVLGWSEEIWDFSELDAENEKYPKLK